MCANWSRSSSGRSHKSGGSPGSTRRSLQSNSNAERIRISSHVSCVICSEQYKAADNIYAGTCGHVFHWTCLLRWWEESKKCPVCRSTSADYFQIFLDFEETVSCQKQSLGNEVAGASEHENLLYEAELYRNEIEYLNARIRHLKFKCEQFSSMFDDSD
ncbi:hypothetical protein ACLKA6_009839 [Drosophila palustris]